MSCSRACDFTKCVDGKWYVMLGNHEYAYEPHQCTVYGPFDTEELAQNYVWKNHSNPGSSNSDDSGTALVPQAFTTPRGYRR